MLVIFSGPQPPDISIHKAAGEGNIEAVKQHLAAGTDVDSNKNGGQTPLYSAVQENRKKMVELLIAEGANVNAKSRFGRAGGVTPLDWAIQMNRTFGYGPEIADLLRKHGGKSTIR
nr:ankyrin repeat domain-containing protein [Gammaproteobacteria bacterium]